MASPPRRKPRCEYPGCPEKVISKGRCSGHYQQGRRHPGEPLQPLLDYNRAEALFRMPGIRLNGPERAALRKAAKRASLTVYALMSLWIRTNLREFLPGA